jgi:hypothetical protein
MNSIPFRRRALVTLPLIYLLFISTTAVWAGAGDAKGGNRRHGMVDFPETVKENLKDKHNTQTNTTKAQNRLGKIYDPKEVKETLRRHRQEQEAEFDKKMRNNPTIYKTLDERRKRIEESPPSP